MKVHNMNLLLTTFRGSSGENLLEGVQDYRTLILPNDKIKDSEKLIAMMESERFDYVISFGQRPNIRNKIHIETTARDGEVSIDTDFDCVKLKQFLEQEGMVTKLSHNAGTSFCNRLYLNGLRYILENTLDTKMVFVHIPFMKNVSDFNSFRKQIFAVLAAIDKGEMEQESDAECYAICEKKNDIAIGAVELKLNGHTDMTERDDECELGYWLGKPF